MAAGGVQSVKIKLDNLCIDHHSKAVLTGHSLSEAEGGSLMKNIGKEFKDYLKTNVNIGSLTDYIFIRNVYKTVYEKVKSHLQDSDGKLINEKKQFHICGTPMIGKTHFLYYVLAWLPVDFPELPGIATLGVIPGTSSQMEWFNELKCVQTVDADKKVHHTLDVAEFAHNEPIFNSKEVQRRYNNYIFLIDNAKNQYVYNHMNTCIVFVSPKLESHDLITNVKIDATMYWIPVWSPEEISQFVGLLPSSLPVGEKNDIPYLVRNFGGTIGNMMHKNRQSRFKTLKVKCHTAATNFVLATVICQESTEVIAEFSSLVENVVTEDHQLAGMKYVSAFVTQEIMGKYLRGQSITFAQFWNDGAVQAPGEYGKIYERHFPFFMSKGDTLEITVAPFADGKKAGYFNNSKEVTMKFTDYVFHKEKKWSLLHTGWWSGWNVS